MGQVTPVYSDKIILEVSIKAYLHSSAKRALSGVILETEGSVRKIQKRALFHYKTVKTGTPNLTSLYVHGLFTIALIKQIFEKNKSLRAASWNRTQFKPEINPNCFTQPPFIFATQRLITPLQPITFCTGFSSPKSMNSKYSLISWKILY